MDNNVFMEKEILKLENKLNKTNNKLNKLVSKKKKNYLDEYKIKKYEERIEYLKTLVNYSNNSNKSDYDIKKAILKQKMKRNQILYGNITRTIIMICFPLALYGFFNSFYALIDSLMASRIKSAGDSGGINVSNVAVISQLKSMISAFGAGIAGGGAVLVSRYYGAGKIEKARRSASNMLLLNVTTSLIVILFIAPLAKVILKIAEVPQINGDVILYFELILIELVMVSINNVFIGIEKIKGNGKKILYLNLAVLLIKLLMNSIFIFIFKVDKIIYLEIATIIGQTFLFTFGLFVLFSKKNLLAVSIKYMKPSSTFIIPILKLSIPIFLGKFVMSLGKVAVNALCGAYYSEATDGLITGALGVSNNLSGLVTSTTSVFEEGESTIVSQNIGNSNLKRTLKTFNKTILIVAIISIIGYFLVRFAFIDQLSNLFNTKKDTRMPTYMKEIFIYDSISIPSLGLTIALLGLLYGYGQTFLSSILNFSRIGIRIISLVVCHSIGLDYRAAGISMGISNVLIGVMALSFLIIFIIKLKKNGYKGLTIN